MSFPNQNYNFTVVNEANFNSLVANSASVAGDVSISGDLAVAGNIISSGSITQGDLDVTGNLSVTGNSGSCGRRHHRRPGVKPGELHGTRVGAVSVGRTSPSAAPPSRSADFGVGGDINMQIRRARRHDDLRRRCRCTEMSNIAPICDHRGRRPAWFFRPGPSPNNRHRAWTNVGPAIIGSSPGRRSFPVQRKFPVPIDLVIFYEHDPHLSTGARSQSGNNPIRESRAGSSGGLKHWCFWCFGS